MCDSPSSETPRCLIANPWYADEIGDICACLDQLVAARWPGWRMCLIRRSPLVRGVALWYLGRDFDYVAVVGWHGPTLPLLILQAIFGRSKRVVFFELISRSPSKSRVLRGVHGAWFRLVRRPGLGRSLQMAQVLTRWELAEYAAQYKLPPTRFKHVPWPWCRRARNIPPQRPTQTRVFSSGRAFCDWETLMSAAAGSDWDLTIVCTEKELPRVERLNRGVGAKLLCDVGLDEHRAMLEQSSVYVICLVPGEVSVGQVRLMEAVDAGIAVVVSRSRGLDGYLVEQETAAVVASSDPTAMRGTIDRLLSNPAERERLSSNASARAAKWTQADYFATLKQLIRDLPAAESADPNPSEPKRLALVTGWLEEHGYHRRSISTASPFLVGSAAYLLRGHSRGLSGPSRLAPRPRRGPARTYDAR